MISSSMARRSTNGAGFAKPEASQRCVASGNLLFRWIVDMAVLRRVDVHRFVLRPMASATRRLVSAGCASSAGRPVKAARFAVKSDLLGACLAANSGFAGFSASSRAAPPSAAVFVSSL
jgi:hypothetical protein